MIVRKISRTVQTLLVLFLSGFTAHPLIKIEYPTDGTILPQGTHTIPLELALIRPPPLDGGEGDVGGETGSVMCVCVGLIVGEAGETHIDWRLDSTSAQPFETQSEGWGQQDMNCIPVQFVGEGTIMRPDTTVGLRRSGWVGASGFSKRLVR